MQMHAALSSSRLGTRWRTRCSVLLVVVSMVAVLVWIVVFSTWNVCRPDLDDDVEALNADAAAVSSTSRSRRPAKVCLSPEIDSAGRRVDIAIDSDDDLRRYNVSASAAKPYTSIIHVMWNSSEIPKRWKRSAKSCVTKNRDFAYCLWTHAELEAFVADEYPWLLSTYDDYPYLIQRCDVARYMLLYRYGGTYVDLDVVCRAPLSVVFAAVPVEAGVVVTPALPIGFATDFMAVRRPRDPVVRGVLSGVRRAATSWWYLPLPYTTVMYRTGPVYFTRRINCHDRHHQVFVISPSDRIDYIGYVGGASWHRWDGRIIWSMFLQRRELLRRTKVITFKLFVVAALIWIFRTRRSIASYLRNRLCQRLRTHTIAS